eukprot:8150234-Ditylum_brightwellii.AAC.1
MQQQNRNNPKFNNDPTIDLKLWFYLYQLNRCARHYLPQGQHCHPMGSWHAGDDYSLTLKVAQECHNQFYGTKWIAF